MLGNERHKHRKINNELERKLEGQVKVVESIGVSADINNNEGKITAIQNEMKNLKQGLDELRKTVNDHESNLSRLMKDWKVNFNENCKKTLKNIFRETLKSSIMYFYAFIFSNLRMI